jgi:predicted O-methyltransferase YrrM
MTQEQFADVDRYLVDLFVGEDTALDRAQEAADAAGLPQIQVAPNQGKLLMLLALVSGAKRILEIGTLGGYSTIWLARALRETGKLVTLEFEPLHAKVARRNIDAAGLGDRVDIVVGPALSTLPGLDGPFDLVFIDADKENYAGYLEWSIRLSRPGTLIIADNVVREGKVIDAGETEPRVVGARQFNALLAADPRVDATAIQVVGGKGWDGFAIARVK